MKYMIGDLLQAVRDAESNAEKMLADANESARQIVMETNGIIARINDETEEKIMKMNAQIEAELTAVDTTPPTAPMPNASKIEKAEKLIITEFQKRFPK